MALLENGDVWSWGYGGNGRLGHGSETDEKRPREVEILKGKAIVQLACGGYHTAALNAKGELYTWGWNHYGQLGYETATDDITVPTLVKELKSKKTTYVTCGEGHTIAISS